MSVDLTERQRVILLGMAAGCPAKVTARDLDVSVKLIEFERTKLFKHLGVKNASEAVFVACKAGVI